MGIYGGRSLNWPTLRVLVGTETQDPTGCVVAILEICVSLVL